MKDRDELLNISVQLAVAMSAHCTNSDDTRKVNILAIEQAYELIDLVDKRCNLNAFTSFRDKRKELGLTQKKLSELTGINQAVISQIESGLRTLHIGPARKFGESCGFDWKELFE